MKHHILSHEPGLITGERLRYLWRKNPLDGKKRLNAQYKKLPGTVRWENFPIEHEMVESETQRRIPILHAPAMPPRYSTYEAVSAVGSKFDTFDAALFDLEEDTRDPGYGVNHYGYRFRDRKSGLLNIPYVTHVFALPFRESNVPFILNGPPLSLRGTEAIVLLDKAQEEGLKLNKDFEFQKTSQYIRVVSDDMRLFLADNVTTWEEFDMELRISHPHDMQYDFYIDDLKEKQRE